MIITNCPRCGAMNATTTCTKCGWSQFTKSTVSTGVLLDDYKRLLLENRNLNARIAELEAERRWVPVSERLPEAETRVLVATPTGYMEVDWRFSEPIIDCGLANFYSLDNVTHWMPLPESPNDTQKEQE